MPDAHDGVLRESGLRRHQSRAPMRAVGWHRLQGLRDHFFHLCVADRPWCTWARLIQQSLEPLAPKPLSPYAHRGRRKTESFCKYTTSSTVAAPEHNASADIHSLRGLTTKRQGVELLDFFRRQIEGFSRTTRGHNSVCATHLYYSMYFSLRTLVRSFRLSHRRTRCCRPERLPGSAA
jgi:hypothetical protein